MYASNDHNSIRSIAYFIPALILTMAARVGTSSFMVSSQGGIYDETLFRAAGGVPLALQLIEYILAVACFVLLYRLAEVDVWVDIANTMFLCYTLSSVAVRVVEWVAYKLDPSGVAEAAFLIAGEVPLVFILLGVSFFINGMKEVYPKIHENGGKKLGKKQKDFARARGFWILGMHLLIIAELLLEIFILHLKVSNAMPVRIISFVLGFLFILCCIPFTLRIQNFCYEYYMFCYNRGR